MIHDMKYTLLIRLFPFSSFTRFLFRRSGVSQPGGTFSGQVHSKIDRLTKLKEETHKLTDKPAFRKPRLKSTRFFFFFFF